MIMCTCVHRLLIAIVLMTTVAFCRFCPQQNHTDSPKFTKKLGHLDYVRFSHEIAIICCAEGYDHITWYRKENNTWHDFPPSSQGDSSTPVLEENGQILRIFEAELTDQTSYRCNVEGKSQTIQHTTYLVVVECDPLARGPILTDPFPKNKTIYEYGANITLDCTGYFGCSEPGSIQIATWRVNGSSAQKVSPRYEVKTVTNIERTVIQSSLTIASVQAEDTKMTFLCVLATPQSIKGQTITKVHIFKKEKPYVPIVPWAVIGLIIGGCLLFIIVVIIVVICLRCMYGPQIRLFFSSRFAFLGPRNVDEEKKYVYNVFIYHAEEDEQTASTIKKELVDKQYNVYVTADIQGNQSVIKTFSEKTAESAMVLFLYSEALRKDDLANILLQAFIIERKGKDIMFLEVNDYKPKEIMDWAKNAKDIGQFQDSDKHEPATTNDEIEKDTGRNKVDDVHFWKVLPRLKVPPEDSNERKKKYFWCSLQNKIPKFAKKHDIDQNDREKRLTGQKNSFEGNRDSEPLIRITETQTAEGLVPRISEQAYTLSYEYDVDETVTLNREITEGVEIPMKKSAEALTNVELPADVMQPLCHDISPNANNLSIADNVDIEIKKDDVKDPSEITTKSQPKDDFEGEFEVNDIENQSGITKNPQQTSSNESVKLNLIIKPLAERSSSSSSPESGYVTSPTERTFSSGTFLPNIKEQESNKDFAVLSHEARIDHPS